MSIEEHLVSKPQLAQAMQWDPTDATLAGGEQALAAMVDILLHQADRLDAAELTALAEVLTAYAQEVQSQEEAAWHIINSRQQQ